MLLKKFNVIAQVWSGLPHLLNDSRLINNQNTNFELFNQIESFIKAYITKLLLSGLATWWEVIKLLKIFK